MTDDVRSRPGKALLGSRVFVALALSALCAIGIAKGASERAKDYHVYERAGARFIAGEPLYVSSDLPMPFKYPPPAAVLLAPWSLIPRAAGGALWNVLSAVCVALALRRWATCAAEAALAIACSFQSLFSLMDHGQVDAMILALLTFSVDWRQRKPFLAGALWGFACLLKPPAGLLLFPILLERRGAIIAGALAVGAATGTMVLARYGPNEAWALLGEWRSLLSEASAPWYLRHDAQGLPSLLLTVWLGANVGSPPVPAAAEMAIALALSLALFFAVVAAGRLRGDARYAAVAAGVALLSPQAWRANYVVALPLVVLVARRWHAAEASRINGLGLTLVSLFLVQLIFGEGLLPDVVLDTALAHWRPFALAYAALLLAFSSSSFANSRLASEMSRAPRR